MLEIGIQITGQNTLIALSGQFNALGAVDFDRQTEGMAAKAPNIILDFKRVTFLSSAGVRSILKMEKEARAVKGSLYIAGILYEVKQVLDLSGLSRFLKVTHDVDEALQKIEKASLKGVTVETDAASFQVRFLEGTHSQMVIWNKQFHATSWITPAGPPLLASSGEFTFAMGTGDFVEGSTTKELPQGRFLTLGKFTGYRPFDQALPFDFIVAAPQGGTGIYVWDGISMVGDPDIEITLRAIDEVSLSRVVHDLFQVIQRSRQQVPGPIGIILEAKGPERGVREERKETTRTYLIGAVAYNLKALLDSNEPESLRYFESRNWHPAGDDIYYSAITAVTDMVGDHERTGESRHIPEPDLEHLTDLLDKADIPGISIARAWIYWPESCMPASEQRLKIVRNDDAFFQNAWEFIARDLYRNCSKLVLTPIHGGFMASTFFADSFDKEGRRLLPTVLKIAAKEIIDREEANYNEYVKKYILNNSTSILGTSAFQQWKGLCYSFVGITGPDSSVEWLTKHYRNRPAEELLPLFDRIFTHILKPWYGQPRLEVIHPYRDHDPRRVLFPNICRDAEEELGISSKEKFILLPELHREIINPYWFLENVFEQRKNYQKLWYRCIAHRDLNMQNILLDEMENVYIIDFSETGFGNAIADFARLEPILKIEMSRLASEEDLLQMVEFEQGLMETDQLDQMPAYHYHGDDPNVKKAYQIICRLRHYADVVTLFEKDLEPYLLTVLEWTLPVVSYKGVDTLRKRYSACSAALICEKILSR